MVEVAGCVNIPLPRIQRLLDVCRKHFRWNDIESDLEIEIVELYNDFFTNEAMTSISDNTEAANAGT